MSGTYVDISAAANLQQHAQYQFRTYSFVSLHVNVCPGFNGLASPSA